jgi:hypothetical protein
VRLAPFLADRAADFFDDARPADRFALFVAPLFAPFLALFVAVRFAALVVDLPADFLADFFAVALAVVFVPALALFLADFFAPPAPFLAPFFAPPPAPFLAALDGIFFAGRRVVRSVARRAVSRAGWSAASSPAPISSVMPLSSTGSIGMENGFGFDAGAGGLSGGIGSIHPDPDQPISLKCSSAIVAPSQHACGATRRRSETRTRLPVNKIHYHKV